MTRDKLLNRICPITRTYDCCNLDTQCYCNDCKQLMNKWLDEYDKHVIEQYKADTGLNDTIREIHDNVAQEMYCKGVDDFVKALQKKNEKKLANPDLALECRKCGIWKNYDIEEIAKQLKAGVNNE